MVEKSGTLTHKGNPKTNKWNLSNWKKHKKLFKIAFESCAGTTTILKHLNVAKASYYKKRSEDPEFKEFVDSLAIPKAAKLVELSKEALPSLLKPKKVWLKKEVLDKNDNVVMLRYQKYIQINTFLLDRILMTNGQFSGFVGNTTDTTTSLAEFAKILDKQNNLDNKKDSKK